MTVDEHGNLVGVLSEQDCMRVALHAGYYGEPGGRVEEYMSTEVRTVESEMMQEGSEALLRSVAERTPIPRLGTPSDLDGIVVYLMSDASAWHTGDLITVDIKKGDLLFKAGRRLKAQDLGVPVLDEDALVTILTEPKNAITKQFMKLFEMEGVELEFRDDALAAVAQRAMERKTGARGLRTILENVLLDTMYDLPSSTSAKKVVVDEAVVTVRQGVRGVALDT